MIWQGYASPLSPSGKEVILKNVKKILCYGSQCLPTDNSLVTNVL